MNDRLDKYLMHHMEDIVFLEFMPDYVKREHLDYMRNVPVPVKKDVVGNLAGNNGIEFYHFVMGMINVIGIRPSFEYASKYISFLKHLHSDIADTAVRVGLGLAQANDLEKACIHLRAALVMDPDNVDALYNYMLVCRNLYLQSDENAYIADFKSEVFESLLALKELKPDFAMTYYYLGFVYINAGKYEEAQREWTEYMRISEPGRERLEIQDRLKELTDPVRIEQGYTDIMSGQWEKGLAVLEEYMETDLMDEWWPLPYYIGVGYNRTGRNQEAVGMLKKALKGNPSSAEIMAELVIANEALGDEVNAQKYRNKIKIVQTDISE